MLKETMRFYNPEKRKEWAFIEDDDNLILVGTCGNVETIKTYYEDEMMENIENQLGVNGEIIEMVNPENALIFINHNFNENEFRNIKKALKRYIDNRKIEK